MARIDVGKDMIRSFSGNEGEDVVAWIKKVSLVARLKGIADVASFLPLYLEGDALKLYLEMDDEDQKDTATIEARLKEAFADSTFGAFEKLRAIRWKGESVDVFANEVKRLCGLSGFTGHGLETAMRLAFITGFPHNLSKDLQQADDLLSMGDLISRARIIAQDTREEMAAATKPFQRRERPMRHPEEKRVNASISCFNCDGRGHIARDCPTNRPERGMRRSRDSIRCFRCTNVGHYASECPGNERGDKTSAPVSSPDQ